MKRYIAIILILAWLLPLYACSNEGALEKNRPQHAVASVSAVGDIFLTDAMLADAKAVSGYDFTALFENVVVPLSKADVTIGNFEGNLIGKDYGMQNGSYPDEFAQALYQTGFDILQTANSYTIFNGLAGLESTKSVIQNSGMQALGTYTSTDDREENQVIVKDVNGIRIAFIAFTKGLGNLAMPEDTDCGVNLLYEDYTSDYSKVNSSAIEDVLEQAKAKEADVIIAALHWGSENQEEISQTQKEITDLMLQNGVDVILGSHSHLVSEIEQRKVQLPDGSEKECVIAYSLGDFCVVDSGECNTSVILDLEFTRNGNQTKISKVESIPISATDCGEEANDRFRLMLTETEIALYEQNYYNCVTTEIYEVLVSELESIRKKLGIEATE